MSARPHTTIVFALASLALASSCAGPRGALPAASHMDAARPRDVAPSADVAVGPRWQLALRFPHLACDGETYDVFLSADGAALTDACSRYDLTTGVHTATTPAQREWTGSSNVRFVTSRDLARTLEIVPLDESSETLRMSARPNDRVLCTRRFPNPLHPNAAASLPDGRFAIFAASGCRRVPTDEFGNSPGFECAERGLFAVDDHCALTPVTVGPDFLSAVVTPEAAQGVLLDRTGVVHVVEMPSGAPITTFNMSTSEPSASDGFTPIAATTDADAIAVVWRGTLSLFEREREGMYRSVLVHHVGTVPMGVYFTPDGATLVVDLFDTIEVFRVTPQ